MKQAAQNPGEADELLEVIRRERGCVTLAVIPLTGHVSVLDACKLVVQHVSFVPPASWVSLPFSAARLHLVRCLNQDLAYHTPCMPKPRAEQLAERFFSL